MLKRKTWLSCVVLLTSGIGIGTWLVAENDLASSVTSEIWSAFGVSTAEAKDNTPLGRKPTAIVDGQYPASYFPNTELLGADEMRITALGTGMPNQTRAAVSISYLVEAGVWFWNYV